MERIRDILAGLIALLVVILALSLSERVESVTLGTMPTEEQPTTHCQ